MEIEHLTDENFSEKAKRQNSVVLIDFFATWCGPCRMQTPILERASKKLEGVEIYKVDVDECEKSAKEFGIMSIPTLVLLKDGNEVAKNVGLLSEEELVDFVNSNK